MATLKIALELGTSFTSIFLDGYGVVLREPSIIAFTGEPKSKKVRAVGRKAYSMTGKTPEKTTVIFPVAEGVIVDTNAAIIMLREFLKRIIPDNLFIAPRFKALLCVPCGLTIEERRDIEDVALSAGIAEVTIIESIIPAAIGAGLNICQPNGCIIADIGGGTTEIAVLSLCGIVSGCSINIGGVNMDESIRDYISVKYNLKTGRAAAEKVKKEIGTLFDNDTASYNVSGIDLETKSPASIEVKSSDVLEAVIPYYHRICDGIKSIINICPPEIAADLYNQGIVFSGGASRIAGLEQLARTRLQLPVVIAADSLHSTITGAGKLLNDEELLTDIFTQN